MISADSPTGDMLDGNCTMNSDGPQAKLVFTDNPSAASICVPIHLSTPTGVRPRIDPIPPPPFPRAARLCFRSLHARQIEALGAHRENNSESASGLADCRPCGRWGIREDNACQHLCVTAMDSPAWMADRARGITRAAWVGMAS